MPELRKCPITERWIILATERSKRPGDFSASTPDDTDSSKCPLCEGKEDGTPPEVLAWRKPNTLPNTPGWDVRVVPNKFPALISNGEVNRSGVGLFDMMTGIGAHEVIIESPSHNTLLADMEIPQIEKVLWAYKQRITTLEADPRFRYVLVFKNQGIPAGASLTHPHSQLIATPITPRYVKLELQNSCTYYREKERCIFCDLMRQELSAGDRLVYENDFFVAFTPFASRFPFELWILPRRHHAHFREATDEEHKQLALCLKDVLSRLKKVLKNSPYNYVLHTAPNPVPRAGKPSYWGTLAYDFHWHIEIIPRLTKVAGFEWGSGLYINPMPPEQAAKYLREA
ncbi:MAG: galactose-1-phosphate uridylyltransferase [Candidatus Saganbacteria bacterium]|nr:galactose-1-phosphate uridylyltransferase [Candidatus Saganbacteria bacterium]